MGNKKSKTSLNNTAELTDEDLQILLNDTSFDREQLLDWHKGFLVSIDVVEYIWLDNLWDLSKVPFVYES